MIKNKYKTILLVEDEPFTAMAEKTALEKCGYHIITANTDKEAIDVFNENNNIDLILMDINLGKSISGPELAEILLKEQEIPVVFLSNHIEPEIIETTERIPSYGYVLKNSGIMVLDASIKTALKLFDRIKQFSDSEIKQTDILSNSSDIICIIDANGIIKYISNNIERIFGWRSQDLSGRELWRMIHKDDLEYIQKTIVSLLKEYNSTQTIEFRHKCNDGGFKPVNSTAVNLINEPNINGVLLNYHDITDLKIIENTFQERERYYRTLFENAGSVIIVIDEDTTVTLVNNAFAEGFGYSREEIENKKKFAEMVYEEDFAYMIKEHHLRRNEPEKAKSCYEFRSKFKHNELRNYLINISLIPGTKKSIATIMDITDRKEAEAVYKIAEKKYRNLFMNSQMGIFITDLNTGLVLEVNDCFAQLFGFKDRDEMLTGSIYIEDFYIDKAVRENMISFLKEHGKVRNYEAQFKRKDGSLFWIRYSLRHIVEKGWIEGVSEDITVLKRIESEKNVIYNELLTSEKKYRLIFENSPLGLLHFDKKGIITDCNSEFEKIIGSNWSPVIGIDLLKLPHQDIISAVASALNGCPGKYEGVYQFPKSARIRFFSAQFEAIYDENESITGGIGIVEDITDKRAVQRTMLDELENERSRIGRILHDSLGQKLGAVLYLAQACSRKYDKTGILSDYDMEQLVDLSSTALEETRCLSRGLDNSIIDLGGFLDSLNEIVVRTRSIYGIVVDLEVKDTLERYDKIKLINLYYIILESINNSIRHGKAKKILLQYHTSETRGFFTITSYQKNILKYGEPGMGLRIMKYRAEVAGMEFSISSVNKTVSVIVALGDEPHINKNNDNPGV